MANLRRFLLPSVSYLTIGKKLQGIAKSKKKKKTQFEETEHVSEPNIERVLELKARNLKQL